MVAASAAALLIAFTGIMANGVHKPQRTEHASVQPSKERQSKSKFAVDNSTSMHPGAEDVPDVAKRLLEHEHLVEEVDQTIGQSLTFFERRDLGDGRTNAINGEMLREEDRRRYSTMLNTLLADNGALVRFNPVGEIASLRDQRPALGLDANGQPTADLDFSFEQRPYSFEQRQYGGRRLAELEGRVDSLAAVIPEVSAVLAGGDGEGPINYPDLAPRQLSRQSGAGQPDAPGESVVADKELVDLKKMNEDAAFERRQLITLNNAIAAPKLFKRYRERFPESRQLDRESLWFEEQLANAQDRGSKNNELSENQSRMYRSYTESLQWQRDQLETEVEQLQTGVTVLRSELEESEAPNERLSKRLEELVRKQTETAATAAQLEKRSNKMLALLDTSGLSAANREKDHLPADELNGVISSVDDDMVGFFLTTETPLRPGQLVTATDAEGVLGKVIVMAVKDGAAVGQLIAAREEAVIAPGARVVAKVAPEAAKTSKRTWRRAAASENAARLLIGDRDELPPQGAHINVVVDGYRARVMVEYYFFNDRDRQLEGAFKLRLPNEASLFYFAFGESSFEYRPQIDSLVSTGVLGAEEFVSGSADPRDIFEPQGRWEGVKEARVVPRVKAAHAYSETVRRKVDPALVEWAGAGVFNAKVFPLTPNKLHRVVIGYDVSLTHDGDDLTYKLQVPEKCGEMKVDLRAMSAPGLTPVVAATVETTPKPLTHRGRTYFHFDDPTGSLELRYKNPGVTLLTGSEKATGDFLAVEAIPPLPVDEKLQAGSSHAIFMLDTSLSSQPERFNSYLDLLRETLNANRSNLSHFALMTFNVEQRWWQESFVANTPEHVAEMVDWCHTLTLEGATDLHAALTASVTPPLAVLRDLPTADRFLLSDGALTWGETNYGILAKAAKSSPGPIFAYKTGHSGESTGVLELLTRETNGALFSVTGEESIPKVAVAHRRRPWKLENVSLSGASDLLIAGNPKSVYPGQRLQLVGRGTADVDSELLFRIARDGEERTLRVPLDRVVESSFAPRLYGQIAVGQLEDLADARKMFRLLTRVTSASPEERVRC